MTLAFALRGSDGLVLGADSRVSSPYHSSDTSTKFLQVNREVGILTYGLAEVGYLSINRLVDEVNHFKNFSGESKKRIVHFTDIVTNAQRICKEEFDKFIPKIQKESPDIQPDDKSLETGFILGGYDGNETNQFKIVNLQSPSFEPDYRQAIIAAQWHISQFLEHHFYYPEMNVEQLKKLASFMLIETETISASVGGRLNLATVTLRDGFQQLNESDVQKLISENQPRFARYRRILLDNLRSG